MRKAVLILIILLSTLFSSKATHIVGGEIYYDYLGNNMYRITLKVYRDCSSNNTNNTQFDDPAVIGIYENGILLHNLSVPMQSMINVPPIINDPCLQVPANICVEQATYVQNVNLPSSAFGYDIVYQRCCRNPSIINIVNSFDYGATYYIHMPSVGLATDNNSPRFSNLPPLVICNGSDFVFDHSATDADGDVLVYEFYTPFHGGDPLAPLPNPPTPPPYTTIIWQTGYNVNTQIQGTPAFNINSSTGLMTGTPNTNGLHVYGVTVKEFRNNVLISQTYRDFQTTVTNCPSVVVSAIPDQVDFCQGNSITFGNSSLNAVYYHWDFGVTTVTNDTSNITVPTYVFADTGTYTITLIANPGYSCADTATSIYSVHEPLDPFFAPQDAQCITANSFDFDADGNFTNNAIINWNFSAAATPSIANTEIVNDVTYSMEGHFLATVNVQQFGCNENYSDSVHVFPLPQIAYVLPPMEGCNPYSAYFIDSTVSWEPTYYIWDFGDGEFSFEQNPTHLYDEVGQYLVSLTVRVDSICTFDTTIIFDDLITVNPSPVANVTSDILEQSAYTPFFIYYDVANGNTSQTIFFDDGTSVVDSTGIPHAYIYSGWHTTTQIAINEFGCTDTAEALVYVIPETTVFAPNTFTPNGDGMNEIFFVHAYDVAYYHLQIFDRWGNLFFETEDPSKGWDGTNKGKKCPQDTYVYRIVYDDMAIIRKKIVGHVNLVR